LLVFPKTQVTVHLNMIHSENGQSQVQQARSKPKGRSTGERIPGAKYRAVMEAAANGHQIARIARDCHMARRTVLAIIERESALIAQRKQILAEKWLRIANRAADRTEDELDTMPIGQVPAVAGIATDKLIALTSDPIQQQTNPHLHVHLQSVDIATQYNTLLHKLINAKSDDSEQCSAPNPKLNTPNVSGSGNLSGNGPPAALTDETTEQRG
jgi:hypothetical protein